MKGSMIIYLLLLSILASCSKERGGEDIAKVRSSGSVHPVSLADFSHTRQVPEEKLVELAGQALKESASLGSAESKRCWENEESRPRVQAACLLLWARGQEPEDTLEAALAAGATRSRDLAVGLLMRKDLFARLSYGDLWAALELLKADGSWLRSSFILAWVEIHGNPGRTETERLFSALGVGDNPSPADLAYSLLLFRRLSISHFETALKAYCRQEVTGEARIRCWRVIGAVSAAQPGQGILPELEIFLPGAHESDWKLFFRSFPLLAHSIHSIRTKEN